MTGAHRVQAGVPAGGQFAPGQHAEGDIELAATADQPAAADAWLEKALGDSIQRKHREQRRMEALSLKTLGVAVQRRFPGARYMTLDNSADRADTFYTGVALDENHEEIPDTEEPLYAELNHLVDNIDAEGSSYVDVATSDDRGVWTLDLAKCAAIEVPDPPSRGLSAAFQPAAVRYYFSDPEDEHVLAGLSEDDVARVAERASLSGRVDDAYRDAIESGAARLRAERRHEAGQPSAI